MSIWPYGFMIPKELIQFRLGMVDVWTEQTFAGPTKKDSFTLLALGVQLAVCQTGVSSRGEHTMEYTNHLQL